MTMTTHQKFAWTALGVFFVFWLCWAAMMAERYFGGRDIVKITLLPSIELSGWMLHRDGWPLVVAALLQFPFYGVVFYFAWRHDRPRRGIFTIGGIHAAPALFAFILVWPYLTTTPNKTLPGSVGSSAPRFTSPGPAWLSSPRSATPS